MGIQVWCSCGKQMLAQDQWAGRQIKCPQCGATVTVGDTTAALPGAQEQDSFLNDARFFAKDVSPFAAKTPSGQAKRGWFSWLFWKFPSFGSSLKWSEPLAYHVRLRGDMLRRFTIVFAVWAAGTGGLLVLESDG